MSYELNLDDVFDLKDGSYIVLDKYVYNDVTYYFVNKLLSEDEPGKEFFVYKGLPNGIVREKNEEVLKFVLEVFSKHMNEKIEYLNDMKNSEGE